MREVYRFNGTASGYLARYNRFDYGAIAPGDMLAWYHYRNGSIYARFFMKVISVPMPHDGFFIQEHGNVKVQFLDGRQAKLFNERFYLENRFTSQMTDIPRSIRGLAGRMLGGLNHSDPESILDDKSGFVVYKATDADTLRRDMQEEMDCRRRAIAQGLR